jgi:hypothetical protein
MWHMIRRLVLLIPALLAVTFCGCSGDPVVGLVFLEGPQQWHRGCIMGSTDTFPVVAHTKDPAEMLLGLVEGFPGEGTYGPLGGLYEGQGSLLMLARREGWETAVFASPRDQVRPTVAQLATRADFAKLYEGSFSSWEPLALDAVCWVAATKAPRFVLLQLSLVDLPPGGRGSAALVSFWRTLNLLFDNTDGSRDLLVIYLPEDSQLPGYQRPALLRIMGNRHDLIPKTGLCLSSLDVAPTVGNLLKLHLLPDYPGQSLAVWAATRQRIRPLCVCVERRPMVLGTQSLVFCEAQEDTSLQDRIRFYDVSTGSSEVTPGGLAEQSVLLGQLIHEGR